MAFLSVFSRFSRIVLKTDVKFENIEDRCLYGFCLKFNIIYKFC